MSLYEQAQKAKETYRQQKVQKLEHAVRTLISEIGDDLEALVLSSAQEGRSRCLLFDCSNDHEYVGVSIQEVSDSPLYDQGIDAITDRLGPHFWIETKDEYGRFKVTLFWGEKVGEPEKDVSDDE